MPVLNRPEIKKEDLGELAKIFSKDISPRFDQTSAVAHFYLTPDGSICVDSDDFESGLIDAKPAKILEYALPENFVAVYDSTGDNGTHRIAVYEKPKDKNKYAPIPEQNTLALEQAS